MPVGDEPGPPVGPPANATTDPETAGAPNPTKFPPPPGMGVAVVATAVSGPPGVAAVNTPPPRGPNPAKATRVPEMDGNRKLPNGPPTPGIEVDGVVSATFVIAPVP